MRRQKTNAAAPKQLRKVGVPGAAPSVGAAPKRLRSQSMAPNVNAPDTREYGKQLQFGPPRGFNLGGSI